MRWIASLDRRRIVALPLFVTLTYPGSLVPDGRASKAHLKAFCKRLLRRWPGACVLWRVERQKRGAPHYHLLVLGVRFIPHGWVSRAWFEVVGSGDPAHLAAGTEVRAVRSWRGVMSYVGKYLAKLEAEGSEDELGRIWGIVGRDNLPVVWLSVRVSRREFEQLRRLLRRFTQARSRGLRYRYKARDAGLWVFMDWRAGKRLLGCVGGV